MPVDPGQVNTKARAMLSALVDRITREKALTQSYGITEIEISWEAGRTKLVRIKDQVTHKFPD